MACRFHLAEGRKIDEDCPPIAEMEWEELVEYVQLNFSEEVYQESEHYARNLQETVDHHWMIERAEVFLTLSYVKSSIARALREGDPCYGTSTPAERQSTHMPAVPRVRASHA